MTTRTYSVDPSDVNRECNASIQVTGSRCSWADGWRRALATITWRWRDAHAPLTNKRRLDAWSLRYYGVEGQESSASAARFAFGRTVPALMLRDHRPGHEKQRTCRHENVVSGTGGMGDGLFCLDCGIDKYPESFPNHGTILREATPEDWTVINAFSGKQ